MEQMKHNKEEDFLASYHIEKYDRPSDAVDMAVFTIKNEETKNIRKLSKKKLSLLLIKRGEHPYMDDWALPGGFLRKGETLEEAAYRELKEETSVTDVYLSQLHNFSDPGRDPRGWIISNAFLALAEENLFEIKSGTDAIDAKWFQITFTKESEHIENTPNEKMIKKQYQLKLVNSEIELEAMIEKQTRITSKRVKTNFLLVNSKGLAFDHGLIIAFAINHLRESLNTSMLAFELVPEQFTLTELQQVYETVLDEELLPANFRRKIADYVLETDEWVKGSGFRPSKLFRRNIDAFNL